MHYAKPIGLFSSAAAVVALTCAVGCASTPRSSAVASSTAARAMLIDLSEVDAQMEAEAAEDPQPTRVQRLYERDGATVMLRHFQRGAFVPDHTVPGTVMAHVLQGRLEITVGDQVHTVSAGQVLVMQPKTEHNVRAIQNSRMLLTVASTP